LIVQPASYLEGIALDVVNHSSVALNIAPVGLVGTIV
jgi:hypothetical protein